MPVKPRETPVPDVAKGYYRLTQDVANPKPDRRRSRHRDSQEVWKAGTLVKVTPPNDGYVGRVEFTDGTHVLYGGGGMKKENIEQRMGDGIVVYLEPAPDTLGIVLRETSIEADAVLAHLLETGRLSLADVATAAGEVDKMSAGDDPDDDEYNALRKKHGLAYYSQE